MRVRAGVSLLGILSLWAGASYGFAVLVPPGGENNEVAFLAASGEIAVVRCPHSTAEEVDPHCGGRSLVGRVPRAEYHKRVLRFHAVPEEFNHERSLVQASQRLVRLRQRESEETDAGRKAVIEQEIGRLTGIQAKLLAAKKTIDKIEAGGRRHFIDAVVDSEDYQIIHWALRQVARDPASGNVWFVGADGVSCHDVSTYCPSPYRVVTESDLESIKSRTFWQTDLSETLGAAQSLWTYSCSSNYASTYALWPYQNGSGYFVARLYNPSTTPLPVLCVGNPK